MFLLKVFANERYREVLMCGTPIAQLVVHEDGNLGSSPALGTS